MLMETTVYVSGGREDVLRVVRSVPTALRSGSRAADAVLTRTGTTLLSRVRRAFGVKSRGGTDETGERWRPLAPSTKARRSKPHPSVRAKYRPSYALTGAQRDAWWAAYRSALARYHDKGIAARVAWAKLKRSGAETLKDKYSAPLILRDTDALYRSLTPAAPMNVFRVGRGNVAVGTTRKGASAHHKGGRHLPQRRLWPQVGRWTPEWWQEILVATRDGTVEMLTGMLENA